MNKQDRKIIEKISATIEECRIDLESLSEEERDKVYNMPDNLQESERAQKFEENADELDEVCSELDEIIDRLNELI